MVAVDRNTKFSFKLNKAEKTAIFTRMKLRSIFVNLEKKDICKANTRNA